jgi:hypothetical protein
MNERIKELTIEATSFTQAWATKLVEVTPKEWDDTYKEKFAELIVRECIQAALDNDDVFTAHEIGIRLGVWTK